MTGRALDQNFTMDEAADWLSNTAQSVVDFPGNLPLANDIEVRQFGRQPCNAGDLSTVQDAIVPRRIVADDERSPLPLEFYKAVIHGARPRETHRGALVRP